MPVQFFLRRTVRGTQPNQQEYLFLVADRLSIGTSEKSPMLDLPLNDSSNVAGRDIPNLNINLGNHRQVIQANGNFINLKQVHFPPNLPCNSYNLVKVPTGSPYVPSGNCVPATYLPLPSNSSAPPSETDSDLARRPTAKNMRSMVLNFFADQTSYTDICLGYPEWLDRGVVDYFPDGMWLSPSGSYGPRGDGTFTPSDPAMPADAIGYRLWRGTVISFNAAEASSELKQYPWTMTFTVGRGL